LKCLNIPHLDGQKLVHIPVVPEAAPDNPRTHSKEQVRKIAASIRRFGFRNPVLIDDDNNVVAGHGRLLAAAELGLETVPTLLISGMTEAERRAYIIADNRLAECAGWDDARLASELAAIASLDGELRPRADRVRRRRAREAARAGSPPGRRARRGPEVDPDARLVSRPATSGCSASTG
jgi:ParB-like chromosome segregation protein Spo0J